MDDKTIDNAFKIDTYLIDSITNYQNLNKKLIKGLIATICLCIVTSILTIVFFLNVISNQHADFMDFLNSTSFEVHLETTTITESGDVNTSGNINN